MSDEREGLELKVGTRANKSTTEKKKLIVNATLTRIVYYLD